MFKVNNRYYKILIFMFLNCQNCFWANAQHYVPFPTDSAIWRIDYFSQSCIPSPPTPAASYQYIIDGDTTINSNTYKKLSRSGFTSCIPLDPYAGAFRDDTLARIVYFIPPDSINETILYDFNLNTGDTIRGYFDKFNSGSITIGNVDTVVLGGIQRKRMSINAVNINPFFIEGIGNLTGLIEEDLDVIDFGYQLICFSKNGNTIYPDSSTVCNLVNNISESNNFNSIEILCNPFSIQTTIKSQNIPISNISIYDPSGKAIMKKIVNGFSTTISKDEIDGGVLFCRVKLTNDKIIIIKLLAF